MAGANQLVIYITDTIQFLDQPDHAYTLVAQKTKELLHGREILAALEGMDELESEIAALRTMRDENAQYITALESDVEKLRADLHECYDLLEHR
jgi:hypothetical protein